MWMGVSRPIEDHDWGLQNPDLSILDRISSSLDSNWDKRITSIKDIEVFIMAIENVHLYNKPDQDHHRVLSLLNIPKEIVDRINIFDASLIKKMSQYFKPMVNNRLKGLAQLQEVKREQ